VKQISQNVSNSPNFSEEEEEKGLKHAIFNADKPQNTNNIRPVEVAKGSENRRFSLNSEGKAKTFFKISSVNSEKKEKAENFNEKEIEESSFDEFEKNLQNEEISDSENIDEITCANNIDCFSKEAKSSFNKIFTTTVIDKSKKAAPINFKVIKNRERYNSTNTVSSLNFNSYQSNYHSNNNNVGNTNLNNNPLSSISNPLLSSAALAANENNFNNVVKSKEITDNNFSSEICLNNYVNSNTTSSNSVVNNLNSISNLNINSNINLHNNKKINFNSNSINTHNSNSNSNQLNNKMEDDLYDYNNLEHTRIQSNNKSKPNAKTNSNYSNSAYLNNKENINSSGENQKGNGLIENNNNNNLNINNNFNNQNMKNSKTNMNAGKQQVFDLNSIGNQNDYLNAQSNYNINLKNIQNQTPASNTSNINTQLQFFGNSNHQEFFNDSNPQASNSKVNIGNQNIRSYAQQSYPAYQSQNFPFYEKEKFSAASTAAQNYNNFNNFHPTAENLTKKRNKENEEGLNFNSLYINSANFSNSVSLRQHQHNMYSSAMPQSYLNPYSHQYIANMPYGVPVINSAFPGNAVMMGMNAVASPERKPLRCKENYIDELLGIFI